MASLLLVPGVHAGDSVDEIHYTYTGATSVTFDWRGAATDIRYGPTSAYTQTVTASTPNPLPFSSPGPFQEAKLTGLTAGTTYHYSIGGGPDHTFSTAPTGNFRFDVMGDIGSSHDFSTIPTVMSQVAADNPAFVIGDGDLTYGYPNGQASVDSHFNDVMAWSLGAAYMPSWGNHEWDTPSVDDLRNYKGRFDLPHPQTVANAPAPGCCGEDWSWFDAGPVRFINYPEPYTSSTYSQWQQAADPIFAAAQNDPSIKFIVTFGHRPAYSTGLHPGETNLASALNTLGDRYSKYVLNINGHSHDYERFQPIHGVTHITTGGGGSPLETPWQTTDPRTVFRAMHIEHLRVDVSSTGLRVDAICGPPTSQDDIACVQGSVIDSYTIGADPPPPPPPPPTLYVDKGNANCSDTGQGTATQPFCSIKPAAQRVVAGQTVMVYSGTYNEQVSVASSGTSSAPINFVAAPGAKVTITGATDGFYISGRSYVTVQGFTVTQTTGDGFAVKNSDNITLRGNDASFAGQPVKDKTGKGIRFEACTNCLAANNKLHDNTMYGIYLTAGTTGTEVSGNQVWNNAAQYSRMAAGIRVYQSSGNTISGNVSHDNEDSGIEFFNTANNNLAVNNIVYDNGDHGIDDNAATGIRFIGNTAYGNETAGLNAENSSTGDTFENNISVDNGVNSTRTRSNLRVDATSTSGATLDYDLVYLSAPGQMIAWGSSTYSSLTAFVAATHNETHGIQANPLWEDPANGDFDLRAGSPAIDSADSGASGEPAADPHGNPRVDDPAVANTGAGSRRYDDRGALEHQIEDEGDAPPNAVLSVSPSSGTTPLAVTADASGSTDTDVYPIDHYSFDFGDGTVTGPQTDPTAGHTYRSVGTFTVTVTVTDRNGLSSTATTQVKANKPPDAPPQAVIAATPTSGTTPLPVTLDASGSSDTDDTPIASYRFDFGDGTTTDSQSGASGAHTYQTAGTYTATVTVTDTAGLSSSASTQITVSNPPDAPPAAVLSVSPTSGLAPLAVTADASASTDTDFAPISNYSFDFGDGTIVGPQSSPMAAHSYILPGVYTVTATVTDTAGLSSIATRQVTVDLASPPTANLSVTPNSGPAPLAVTADASGSKADSDKNAIDSYAFDFGDGTTTGRQTASSANHTYTVPGTYTVTVTVTDSGGLSSTASTQVTVTTPPDAPPSAVLTVTPHVGTVPFTVSADASGSTDTDAAPIATYRFDYGDGTVDGPQAGATDTHQYTTPGTYTVTVTVTDTAGLSSVATTQVTASAPDKPPAATMSVNPSSGLAPLQVVADASGSTDTDADPIDTYRFDFGDGTSAVGPQSSPTAAHTYTSPGVYTAKVTVTDTAGAASIATVQVTVYASFVGNSGFESDLTGWNTSGGGTGISLTRVSGSPHTGSWAAKLTNTNTTAQTILLNDAPDWAKPTSAGTYTGSLWVRADTAGAKLQLRFREYAGSTLAGSATTTVTLSTTWQLVTVNYKVVSPGSTLDFNAYTTGAAPGASFYADDASIYLAP